MKRHQGHDGQVGDADGIAGSIAPGKRTHSERLAAQVGPAATAAPLAPTRPDTGPHDDPFGLHLLDGLAAPDGPGTPADDAADATAGGEAEAAAPVLAAASVAPVQMQRAAGSKNKPPAAAPRPPAVRDPIVRGAAAHAKRIPGHIAALRKLSTDFAAARSQLDADSVGAIGLALAIEAQAAADALHWLEFGLGDAELLGPVGVEYSADPRGDQHAARNDELGRLEQSYGHLASWFSVESLVVVHRVRPTSFRHQIVPGTGLKIPSDELPAYVREQTVKTILLIDAIDETKSMLAGVDGQPPEVANSLRKRCGQRLEAWTSDRDAFLFLSHALERLGHGGLLDERGADGKPLRQTVSAVTRGVPQRLDDVIDVVREAKQLPLGSPPAPDAAAHTLTLARERLDEIARFDKVRASLPKSTHGRTVEDAWRLAQDARQEVHALWRSVKRGERIGVGVWDLGIKRIEAGATILRVVTGETVYEASPFPLMALGADAAPGMVATGASLGAAAAGGIAAAPAIAARLAALAEVGAGVYAAATILVVRNPYAATALAEFAASVGFNVIEAGGVGNFLEQLKTPEGALQLVMDVLVLKQSMGGGRYVGNEADVPDGAPRRAPAQDDGPSLADQVRDALDRMRAVKATVVELAQQPRVPGQAAVTPDGVVVPVPGRSGDAPSVKTIYAEQLKAQREARAARSSRRMWPTAEAWEAEYHPPPVGKDAVQVREKILQRAKERHPTTNDMPADQQAEQHFKQREYFAKVEARARDRREQLEVDLIDAPSEKHEWIRSEIEGARLTEAAAKVKPAQGRLPINHEYAGSRITIDDIDARLADPTLDAGARTTLQRARKALAESGTQHIEYTEDGFPDFSPWVYERNGKKAQIDMYLRGTRALDDSLARERFAAELGVARFKEPPGYTWHHSEHTGRMILVPTAIHDAFKHTGGVPLWRVLTGDYRGYRKASGKDDNDDS